MAALIHLAAAVITITIWIIHVYAAIWVRGTFSAMTRGFVTGGWRRGRAAEGHGPQNSSRSIEFHPRFEVRVPKSNGPTGVILGEEAKPCFADLPDPSSLFLNRAWRFAALASASTRRGWNGNAVANPFLLGY